MGVFAGLIINGPATANYDVDLGSYIVNDWYYQIAYQVADQTNANLQKGSGPPPGNNILINGTNQNASGGGKYRKVVVQSGKKYLLRLINTSLENAIRVSLDNHPFQVVTSDLVPIHPYTTNWVLLHIGETLPCLVSCQLLIVSGQRYDVVFTANQTAGNYWFRVVVETTCFSANEGSGLSIFSYTGAGAANPTSTGTTKPSNCQDEQPLVPWVANNVPSSQFTSQAKTLPIDIELPGTTTNHQNLVVWGVNLTAIDINWQKPTLTYVATGDTNYPVVDNLIEIPNEGTVSPAFSYHYNSAYKMVSGSTGLSKRRLAHLPRFHTPFICTGMTSTS